MTSHRFALALTALTLACASPAAAAPHDPSDALWSPRTIERAAPLRAFAARVVRLRGYMLDASQLRARLTSAGRAGVVISLPLPDGRLARVRAVESPVLGEDVQRTLSDFRSFVARGVDDRTLTARLDLSRLGFRAMLLTTQGTAYLEPLLPGREDAEASFWARDDASNDAPFECSTPPSGEDAHVAGGRVALSGRTAPVSSPSSALSSSGDTLRTFRYVLLADGTFTTHLCGGDTLVALAEMATAMNRMNAIYERDLSIHLQAVWLKAYPDSATDPWRMYPSGVDVNTILADSLVGIDNYDCGMRIGYVPLGYTGGTGLGVLCRDDYDSKAGGNMFGFALNDEYYRIIMHETAHEFGTNHTNDAPCQRAEAPYEPGSGSTIMARANRCSPYNIQLYDDHYFHTWSMSDIAAFIVANGDCSTRTESGNHAPIAVAGPNRTIPRGTPFVLTGSGSDPDPDDALTYCWEDYDKSATPFDPVYGPLLRSRLPSPSPSRAFPPLDSVLAGSTYAWEQLPTNDRVMKFVLTVRDNHPGCGGHASDSMLVMVSGAPFVVTAPNGGEALTSGVPFSVNWTVGGGGVASAVDILLSTDGGATWTPLATGVPNSGADSVTAHLDSTSTRCRIQVKASDNIFYDVSNANFTITANSTGTLVSLLEADVRDDGVLIRWGLAPQFIGVTVQRSPMPEGPWNAVAGGENLAASAAEFLDREAPPGVTNFYRLLAATAGGSTSVFGPIEARLPASVTRLAILSSAPNPTTGRLKVEYAIPSAGQARLRLLDVKGRQCAQLLDREAQPGRYQLIWSGGGADQTPPGVYFLQLESGGARDTRRVIFAR